VRLIATVISASITERRLLRGRLSHVARTSRALTRSTRLASRDAAVCALLEAVQCLTLPEPAPPPRPGAWCQERKRLHRSAHDAARRLATRPPGVAASPVVAGIDDVAQAAGVSTATVSRALRGLPNVSEATRLRVLAEAARLGYVPTPSASSLATGRTRTIGVLTPWVNRWFFANVIEGAERALRDLGYDVLLYTFDVRRTSSRRRVDPSVLRHRVDGTLVVGLPLDDDEVRSLVGLGRPLAFVGSGPADQGTVRLADVATGRAATRHLLDLGNRVIGHVTGLPDLVSSWSPPVERARGYVCALEEAGVVVEPDLEVNGDFDVAGGRESTAELLRRRPDVTAVFAASDEMAMGAILAARDLGLRVPEDLSVVGVDGHDLGELVGLTTIAQDAYQQGFDAALLLLEMINGAPVPESLTYPTELVRRGSTAPPGARS
jgi:DNA-binding LacI/PurR family transcriptional regulator